MKKTEFLIVGNGLAGTLLAFEMLKHGVDFKIVVSPQKTKASLVAAGMFNPLVFKRLTKSWMADDLLPVMKQKYKSLENLLENQFYFEKDIIKPLSSQEQQLWEERKLNSQFSKYIQSVENNAPVRQLIPAAGYGRVTGSGYVNLPDFLNAADNYLKEKGLLVYSELNHQQINPKVKTIKFDDIEAEKIVFCEGAHVAENPFFQFIKLVPVKGEILLLQNPGLQEDFILNKKIFVLPVGNQIFKVGSTYNWKDLSERPTEKGKLFLLEQLKNLISMEFTIEDHWAGIRPAISDRRPVLGAHPEFKNFYIFNGLGTKGVMLTPYFAQEMLKLLTIRNYSINSEVAIMRFAGK